LARLKDDPELCNVPVVMVTQADGEDLGLALGATAFLTKPVNYESLKDTLDGIVAVDVADVLVVEDDEATRQMMRRLLVRGGHRCREATNGREALGLLDDATPDAVLLDLVMPVMDGFEFLDWFRKREECREVPVIVVTSKDLSPSEREHLSERVLSVVTKGPGNRAQLLDMIAQLVGHGQASTS